MIIVVGGHSRKIGKSSVVAALIAEFSWAQWTALKITSHNHDSAGVEPYALTEETAATATDSGRYLAAGAVRSYLLRASGAQLGKALSSLKPILNPAGNVIIESNRIIDLVQPDLYLLVVDPAVDDWKASALRNLSSVDAIVVVRKQRTVPTARALPRSVPQFVVEPPGYSSPELSNFVARRLQAASDVD